MVFTGIGGALRPPVVMEVMKVIQQLSYVSVLSNHAAHVVMRVEQQLAHGLYYFYGKHAPLIIERDEEQLVLGLY